MVKKGQMSWQTDPSGLMKRANKAFGEWLSRPRWDWYTTQTFRAEFVSARQADKAWYAWFNSLCLAAKGEGLARPFYFRVAEYQDRGALHYHSLIGGLGDIRRLGFKDFWELHGFARVLPYEAGKGANYYVGKYLNKTNGDMRFSHNLQSRLDNAM